MSREEQIEDIVRWYKAYQYYINDDITDAENEFKKVDKHVKDLLQMLARSSNPLNNVSVEHYSAYARARLASNFDTISLLLMDMKPGIVGTKLQRYHLIGIDTKMSMIEDSIAKLRVALKILGKKKSHVKEFLFLKNFHSKVAVNYSIAKSIWDEFKTYVGKSLVEFHEDVTELIEDLTSVCKETYEICSQAMDVEYFKLPTSITSHDSTTEVLLKFYTIVIRVKKFVIESIKIINSFVYQNAFFNKSHKLEFSNILDVGTNGDIFPANVTRQLRKALEDFEEMCTEITKQKPAVDNRRIYAQLGSDDHPNFEMFSDQEVNAIYTFFDICSDHVGKIGYTVDLAVGGLMQMADYLYEESDRYEKDYRDLAIGLNKRFNVKTEE
jgi:hypothetical protein